MMRKHWRGLFSLLTAVTVAQSATPAVDPWKVDLEELGGIAGKLRPLLPDPEDPQQQQELYETIYATLSNGYLSTFSADPDHPDFWPIFNTSYNFFAPNPDDIYYGAPLDPKGIYRISGYRGTVRVVYFVIQAAPLYWGRNLGEYDLNKDVHLKPDGSFEVELSEKRPQGYRGDWWPLNPQAASVLVRQVSYDWLHEVDGRLAIERLDRPAMKPRLSAAEIDRKIHEVNSWAQNWTGLGLKWVHDLRAKGVVNRVVVHDLQSIGGPAVQKYIDGAFDLQPDEALIYETELPEHCRFWNVELTNTLWRSIDYLSHQTSLNGYTARIDPDGKFRAVIAATDPGVPNWLDTAGYSQGAIFGRWMDCSSFPQPEVRKVKLAEVRGILPADTPTVTPEARDAALRMRRTGAQLRRRW